MYKTFGMLGGLGVVALIVMFAVEWAMRTSIWENVNITNLGENNKETTKSIQRNHIVIPKQGPDGTESTHLRVKRNVEHSSICSPERAYRFGVHVCVPMNKSTVIMIPYSALRYHETYGSEYGSAYTWYLTIYSGSNPPGWDSVVAETGSNWKKWSTTPNSHKFRNLITLTKTSANLIVTIDLTKENMTSSLPTRDPTKYIQTCMGFWVMAWAHGKDPKFHLIICDLPPNNVSQPSMYNQPGISIIEGVKTSLSEDLDTDSSFHMITGVTQFINNWLLLAENAATMVQSDCVVCLGPRPLLRVVPAQLPAECFMSLMSTTKITPNCILWDKAYPLTDKVRRKPLFSVDVARANFTCLQQTGHSDIGQLNDMQCTTTHRLTCDFRLTVRADLWWWCGKDALYDTIPSNVTAKCGLITLLLPMQIFKIDFTKLRLDPVSDIYSTFVRGKRDTTGKSPTYIDPIGIPRGVPDEYKLVNNIASGFESILPWITNKNVDRINYIHFNVQVLGNCTEKGFRAVHEQLHATSLTAFQNRIAVDMLLAEKGGVCSIFGEACCTLIPNNTSPDGSLTKVIAGLEMMNRRMKAESGIDNPLTRLMESWFGKWRHMATSIIVTLITLVTFLTFCGCCCIPCIRSLCNRLIVKAIEGTDAAQEMPLLQTPVLNEEDEFEMYALIDRRPEADPARVYENMI